MTVVVLGGSGFVGHHLAERWPAAANAPPLRLLLHRSRPNWLSAVEAQQASIDLEDPTSIPAALEGCTVLINLLRPHGDGWAKRAVENLFPALRSSAIRLIVHGGSIDVYGTASDDPITEQTVPQPRTPYAREHLAIEALLAQDSVPATILRLGAVFGPGGRNLVKLAREIAADPGWKLAMRRSLYRKRRMHLVSVETVADAIRFTALRQPDVPVDRLLVTEDDADENNFAFVQDCFATAFGRTIPSVPALPPWCLQLALRATGRAGLNPHRRISGQRLAGLGFRAEPDFVRRIERLATITAQEHSRPQA